MNVITEPMRNLTLQRYEVIRECARAVEVCFNHYSDKPLCESLNTSLENIESALHDVLPNVGISFTQTKRYQKGNRQ